jgi:beta-fructofuranosidase
MLFTRRAFVQSTLASAAALASRAVPAQATQSAALAARLAADPRRPQFHLLPAAGWMNDPNGPIFWKGRYHMFFQFNPHAAVWGDMHWAHAVSPDMVHWRHLPVALSPTPDGPDADGCFSGSTADVHGTPTIIYTAVRAAAPDQATLRDERHSFRESQCIATPADATLVRWDKDPHPVIPSPPPGLAVTGFRDPAPFRQGDDWYLCIGSGVRAEGGKPGKGMVLLYRSRDFRRWEYLHPLAEGEPDDATGAHPGATNPVESGEMWECPDFFPLGPNGRHVLIYSTAGKVFWESGKLDRATMRFAKERSGVLDYGSFYAPKTQLDRDGHRILWGWIPETRPEAEYSAAGWAGMMSLPRVLILDAAGGLRFRFAPQLEQLRGAALRTVRVPLDQGRAALRMNLGRAAAEALLEPDPRLSAFSFSLRDRSNPGDHLLTVSYDAHRQDQLLIDGKHAAVTGRATPNLHMFIDGSVIEVTAGDQAALTKRFYYSGDAAPEIEAVLETDAHHATGLSGWPIHPISANRLTA